MSVLWDSADLETIRTAQELAFPDTCAVKHRVKTANTTGGYVDTWPATSHTYACRLSANGVPRDYLQMAAEKNQQPFVVTFAHDAGVLRDDHLVIGTKTLSLLGFLTGGELETARRVVVVEAL